MPTENYPESSDPRLRLEARVTLLEGILVQFARAGATDDNIAGGGFGSVSDHLETVSRHLQTISAQMAPLAELTQEPALGEDEKKRLVYLIRGWRPPKWNGLTSLSFDLKPVEYIGQVVPKRDGYEHDEDCNYGSTAS
jgi:hypothetical protein